jgi:hypothetical protein
MTIEWNKVTWYSKLIAVVLFVATFWLAFDLGVASEDAHIQANLSGTPLAISTDSGGAIGATTTPPISGGGSILPYQSGIEGTVTTSPTCPVEYNPPKPECAPKPYQTLVAVFRVSDPVHAFAIVHSDAEGKYKISLPPGDYTLGAGESNFPHCDHPSALVPAKAYVTANISCDTGIR